METYLRLNPADEQWYQRQAATMTTIDKEQAMELMSSVGREGWRKGLEEGRQEGLEEGKQEGRQEGVIAVVLHLLQSKFGSAPPALQQRIQTLTATDAQALAEQLMSSITLADVEIWLNSLP